MKRIFMAYKDLISIIFAEAPVMVILSFACTIVSGLLTPLGVYISQNVFDGGLAVARKEMTFSEYSIFLVLFVIMAILPSVIDGYVYGYVERRSLIILRTAYKSRMLKKLKTMKYEHFENEAWLKLLTRHITELKIRQDTYGPCMSIGAEVLLSQVSALWHMFSVSDGGFY